MAVVSLKARIGSWKLKVKSFTPAIRSKGHVSLSADEVVKGRLSNFLFQMKDCALCSPFTFCSAANDALSEKERAGISLSRFVGMFLSVSQSGQGEPGPIMLNHRHVPESLASLAFNFVAASQEGFA